MAVYEEMERRLRRELRFLAEAKVWLERSGAAYENPDALVGIEREMGRIRRMLEELEKERGG